MDVTRDEAAAVENFAGQDEDFRIMTDVQLALIGGGIGDVIVG